VVKRGETVWRISKKYGVTVEAIVRANRIADVTDVPTGARLVIPDPSDPSGSRSVPPPAFPAPNAEAHLRAAREAGLAFGWPLRGSINSRFGGRRGGAHEGIDIGARKGAPIGAAEAGRVIYADKMGDYGRVVILKHVGDWSTVYAHNRRNRVRRGAFVEKGDVIAEVGDSGNASGYHVHFEIRRGQTPVDPLRYLP
jgi:murein DD-endopeptidase MepM/ murein hydrolase activator NlpD